MPDASPLPPSPREVAMATYGRILGAAAEKGPEFLHEARRQLAKADLFFLLVFVLRRRDLNRDWLFDRCREVQAQPDDHLDLWARGHYKDLADDTPMLTANRGWTTHGDLRPGDQVFAPDGQPVPVLAVSAPYLDSECYRVTFSDGAQIVAGAGHQWRVRAKHRLRVANGGRRVTFSDRIVSTVDLLNLGRADVGAASSPLAFPVQQLPLHPYLVGCWLGDGHSAAGRLTCADAEIFDRIRSLGYRIGRPNGITRTIYGIAPTLRSLGILSNKHVPPQYLKASTHQRMELLRGLMDTDGHCDARGTATFCNASRRLAEQVYELAAGLGMRPRFRQHSFASDCAKAKDGRYVYYQVSFQAYQDDNPFWLPRKAARASAIYTHRDTRTVRAVERIASVPTRCIQVLGGHYLAGRELVPTHNSTIVTFGLTIWEIIRDPEITIGIFSDTNKVAKAFLRQIKTELEINADLKALFPDVLWAEPRKQAPKWSEDDGITVKRRANPKEATVEAYGLLDGQPTGRHFRLRVYDDVVTVETVGTTEQIEKVTERLALSDNLGSENGRKRYIGTHYHAADSYVKLLATGTVRPRIYPATDDGTETGEPVLLTPEELAKKRRTMGPYVFACQMLLDPRADRLSGFREEWLRFWDAQSTEGLNLYLIVDPSSGKKQKEQAKSKRASLDYTSMWIVGIGADENLYVVDGLRDRLNLTARTKAVFDFHRRYRPQKVGYEQYGMQADIEHIRDVQDRENYRFDIVELGGALAKQDRIRRLVPLFEQRRIFLPRTLTKYATDGAAYDLTRVFIETEYLNFPVSEHDDMLDCLARMTETEALSIRAPAATTPTQRARDYSLDDQQADPFAWMTA